MSLIGAALLLLPPLAAGQTPAPKFPLGQDTTYVTGPLDAEGYIDYEAALNERLGKGVTPKTNANALLWKALGPAPEGGNRMPPAFFRRLGIEEPPPRGDYLVALDAFLKGRINFEAGGWEELYDKQTRASQRPWKASDFPHLADWLKANEKPLAVAVEATKRPGWFNPLVSRRPQPGSLLGARLSGVQKCRELARALICRAMLRVQEGKFDDAWQDLLASHRLGRLVARGATQIELLVGIAIHQITSNATLAYLERAPLTSRQVLDRLKELQALPPMPPLADKIALGERFTYLDCVQMVRRGGVGMMEGLAGGRATKPTPKEEQALSSIDWTPVLRQGNRCYDRLAAALLLKDAAARQKAIARVEEDITALKKDAVDYAGVFKAIVEGGDPGKQVSKAIGNVLIGLLLPAAGKVQTAHDRAEQTQRNLHLAFALAAYRRDHGRYPAKLADLAPRHLPAVPDDLFSDKPLIYRPSEKGYLLYSVGVNGKDDGGRWQDDDPPGDDLSVRVPLPPRKEKK
jgi:hypothetical protein